MKEEQKEEICVSCQRTLVRKGEDWTCKECEERGIFNRCEECCMNSRLA